MARRPLLGEVMSFYEVTQLMEWAKDRASIQAARISPDGLTTKIAAAGACRSTAHSRAFQENPMDIEAGHGSVEAAHASTQKPKGIAFSNKPPMAKICIDKISITLMRIRMMEIIEMPYGDDVPLLQDASSLCQVRPSSV